MLQQEQNLGQRYGASKIHLSSLVALAAVCSMVVILLWLIRYSLLLLLHCWILDGEERAGCLALFVFLVSRDCCVARPHDAIGLSAVCDCGISGSYSLFSLFVAVLSLFAILILH